MMLATGNQLRAARALVGMDQTTLARAAQVNINTIGSMESRGSAALTSGLDKIKAVMAALEVAGVEFLNDGRPGVRMRAPTIEFSLTVDSTDGPSLSGKDGATAVLVEFDSSAIGEFAGYENRAIRKREALDRLREIANQKYSRGQFQSLGGRRLIRISIDEVTAWRAGRRKAPRD